jgi:sigma-B regulation protein RsbU (phosphoserine phosphatase)
MKKRNLADIQKNNSIIAPSLTILLSIALMFIAPVFEDHYERVIGVSGFLTMHSMLEIANVIACLAIFLVSFYTYRQEHAVKAIVIGSLLLAAGIIDVFHLLSYKGMPDFFIPNLTANRATTFWIAARLIAVMAYLASATMHNDTKSSVSEFWFTAAAVTVSLLIFIIATYFPELLPAMYIEGVGLTFAKKLLEYIIITLSAVAASIYLHRFIKVKNNILFVMFAALALSVMSEFAFTIYVDVYGIYNLLGHILKCISLFMVFSVTFAKFVLTPYTALSAAQDELKEYAANLDRLVEKRTSELKSINNMLIEDLNYARDIQRSMMPSFFPNSPYISFNVLYMPAERLSGDFYDVCWLDDDHIGFYICDVSGHGVPAAMLTVFLKQCIDSLIEADRVRGKLSSPAEILNQVYGAFNHTNFRDEVYIVLIYFIYDTRSKKLVFSSAGMNESPLHLSGDGRLREIGIRGFPICKLRDVYEADYEDMELTACPGDRLFIFTDGIVEIRNDQNEQYSTERLKRLISEKCRTDSEQLISAIKKDLKHYVGAGGPEDDITLMCVEFR